MVISHPPRVAVKTDPDVTSPVKEGTDVLLRCETSARPSPDSYSWFHDAEVVRLFQEKYPELPPISEGTISKIEKQFRERNQMHPYRLVPTNELAEDDFDRGILFYEQMMQMIDDNTLQTENVLFSDESTFTLHDHVTLQNCRYWSRENLHWMRELHTQNPEKVNVWAGIIGENIIGSFFIDGNLNGETYLALLQNNVVPTMANLYPAERNPQLPGCCQDAGGMHFEHLLY
ncbi:hypothetical protein NQ318_017642 [Aromia moschata]|uniref:Ig-like domain-containing protein n=1 Tax=Aromia moschata TaxID=1265417 RepID=A0AAV8Z3R3_9CUCU|nr:hypothetical protein NQ318_017642 [Aromia moschata]